MNRVLALTVGILLLFSAGLLNAQYIAPNPLSEDFPFQVAIMMDERGSFLIFQRVKAQGHSDYLSYYFDGKERHSETSGEFFSGRLDDPKSARMLSRTEARAAFDKFEQVLVSYFGKEKFAEIKSHPINFDKISEEEAEKLCNDPKYNDRFVAQLLLEHIAAYCARK